MSQRARCVLLASPLLAVLFAAAPAAAGSLPPYAMPLQAVAPRPHLPETPDNRLVYHGGRVISNVKIYQVNWGPNVWSQMTSQGPAFFAAVTNSQYLDWLGSQYDTAGRVSSIDGQTTSNQHIGRGSFGTSTTITPTINQTNQVADSDISSELVAQLQAGTLPAPDLDAAGNVNALYVFEFPPGTSIQLQGGLSCQSFLGYHFTTTYQGKSVPYAVIPDFSQDCGNQDWQQAQIAMSHELIESITDAEVGLGTQTSVAWNSDADQGQEIGDLCNGQPGTLGSYTVQLEWSNYDGGCVLASAYRLPVCSGPMQPPSCRLCDAGDDGMACTGATPICDVDPKRTKYGQCVACTDATKCSGATPVCDATTDTCRGCTTDADCKAPMPACATGAADAKHGQCVACTSSAQCSGATPVCDATSDACVECVTDGDCKDPSTPTCTNHTCGKCIGPQCGGSSGGSGSGDAGSSGGSGANGSSGGNDNGNGSQKWNLGGDQPSGCGCGVVDARGDAGAFVLAGFVLAMLRARRRRA
jgi:uncharacterized membrane protein YgcG